MNVRFYNPGVCIVKENVLKLASQLGWEYYMLGPCALPKDFPPEYQPYFIGLVLIAQDTI